MAVHQQVADVTLVCPDCGSQFENTNGTLTCSECRHVPNHGAD